MLCTFTLQTRVTETIPKSFYLWKKYSCHHLPIITYIRFRILEFWTKPKYAPLNASSNRGGSREAWCSIPILVYQYFGQLTWTRGGKMNNILQISPQLYIAKPVTSRHYGRTVMGESLLICIILGLDPEQRHQFWIKLLEIRATNILCTKLEAEVF